MSNKKLICIGGISAIGKSTTAAKIVDHYKEHKNETIRILCPEVTRLKMLNKPKGYVLTNADVDPEVTLQLVDKMLDDAKELLGKSENVIVPTAFMPEHMRAGFEELAKEQGIIFYGFWLEAPFEVIQVRAQKRLEEKENNTLKYLSAYVPDKTMQPTGVVTWQKINANRKPCDILKDILNRLN